MLFSWNEWLIITTKKSNLLSADSILILIVSVKKFHESSSILCIRILKNILFYTFAFLIGKRPQGGYKWLWKFLIPNFKKCKWLHSQKDGIYGKQKWKLVIEPDFVFIYIWSKISPILRFDLLLILFEKVKIATISNVAVLARPLFSDENSFLFSFFSGGGFGGQEEFRIISKSINQKPNWNLKLYSSVFFKNNYNSFFFILCEF